MLESGHHRAVTIIPAVALLCSSMHALASDTGIAAKPDIVLSQEKQSASGTASTTDTAKIIKGSVQILDSGQKGRPPRLQRPASKPLIPQNSIYADRTNVPVSPDWLKSFGEIRNNKKWRGDIEPLTKNELRRLSKFEVAMIIDHSKSMDEGIGWGKGAPISRWEWCRREAESLSNQIASSFPSGITVVPFSTRADRYANVKGEKLNDIFKWTIPDGGTRLDEALGIELDHFLSEKSKNTQTKPLLIAVITDGAPNDPHRAMEEIIHISRKIHRDEVRIVFFMIGEDPRSMAFIDFVKENRIAAGIPFDIVSSHSFVEVNEVGLARCIANASADGSEEKSERK